MQSFHLVPHPKEPLPAGFSINVEATRTTPALLTLVFILQGPVETVLWPPPARLVRQDGLWRTTCLEAFFAAPGQPDYLELNLSPTHAWAAYAFSGYRHGMRDAGLAAPIIETASTQARLRLQATMPLAGLTPFTHVAPTAVIETRTGAKFYWALAHDKDTPDFHTLAGMAPLPK